MVRARHIHQIHRAAGVQGMGAKHDHFLAGEGSIQLVFVFTELFPMVGVDPERWMTRP
jgi:hypothetical protein